MPGCFALLIALGLPVFDVWLLFRIGDDLGGLRTLGLVLLTTFLGLSLARSQRVAAMQAMQAQIAAGRMPTAALADGPMLMLASVLFVLPGFITDGLALALLVPPVRRALFALVARRMLLAAREGRVSVRTFGGAFGSFGAGSAFGAGRPDAGSAGSAGGPDDGTMPASGELFGPSPGAAGSYEASREIKELPPDSYRVRGQDEVP